MKKTVLRSLMLVVLIGSTAHFCYGKVSKSTVKQPLSDEMVPGVVFAQPEYEHKNENLEEKTIKNVTLGRQYYRGLIDNAIERHWVIPVATFANFNYKTFDCNGCLTPLANSVFGNDIHVRDIFLLARLAENNNVHIDQINPLSVLPTYAVRQPASTDPFGWFADDIAVTHLAKVKVSFGSAEQYEYGANISAMYRFRPFGSCTTALVFGATLPVKGCVHRFDMTLSDGDLFIYSFVDNVGIRQNPLQQFFIDYSGLEDFFVRAVLGSKDLIYEPSQNKIGIGDVALFASADFAGALEHVEGLQVGATLVLPTGGKARGDKLWEVVLGNEAYRFDFYSNVIFKSSCSWLNPTLRAVAEVSLPFSSLRRIAQQRSFGYSSEGVLTGDAMVPISLTDIRNPIPQLAGYWVAPFNERDSTSCIFADEVVCANVRPGTRFSGGVGNYFNDIFNLGLRLGIFYDFTYKGCDKLKYVQSKCSTNPFDAGCLQTCTNLKAHRLGWILAYKFESMVELNIGSQHVIAGRNTPQSNEFFASLIAVF